MTVTPEQKVRDILERMDIDGAQEMSAGDVVELANIIAERDYLKGEVKELRKICNELTWENQREQHETGNS